MHLRLRKRNRETTPVIADVIFREEGSISCGISFELENTKTDKSVRTIKQMDIEFLD